MKFTRDEEVNRFLPWFPLASMEEAQIFYEKQFADRYRKNEGYHYAVCFRTDNIPIGYVNVSMEGTTISDMDYAGNSGIRES